MRIHENMRFQTLIDRMERLHREGQLEEMKSVLEELQTLAEIEQDYIGLAASYFYRDVLYGGKPKCLASERTTPEGRGEGYFHQSVQQGQYSQVCAGSNR